MSGASLMPGYRLDRYELLAPIAEGGMGQVWLARLLGKRGFEKLVAIKLSKLSSDISAQHALLDEARIAASIEHVNVAQIVELGEQDEMLYIVMEWVDGDALSTLLRTLDKTKAQLPLSIALRIVSETCAGAHAAHELRAPDGTPLEVVHRDISPQNTLITRGGSVKLIDFGIAKARSRLSEQTTEGTLKGKIKYMAPEQAFGGKIDRRADIFSLGSMLYRIVAGRSPYDGDNEVATLRLLVSGAPPPPLPSSIPAPVASIAMRALAREPGVRFQTAAEMQQAISRAIEECQLRAEAADVAAFMAAHLHARQQQRARAIEIALRAAADRNEVEKLLRPPPTTGTNPSSVSAVAHARSMTGSESLPAASATALSHGSTSAPSMPSSTATGTGHSARSALSGTGTDLAVSSNEAHPDAAWSFETSRLRKVRRLVAATAALGTIGIALIVVAVVSPSSSGSAATVPAAGAAHAESGSTVATGSAGEVASEPAPPTTGAPAVDAAPAPSARSAKASPAVVSTPRVQHAAPSRAAGAPATVKTAKPPKSTPDFGY